jgi:hypothetical protein
VARVIGLKELLAALDKVIVETDEASRGIVVASAALLEAAAKKNFSGSHARGRPHVGGPLPNVVTGNLRRSLTHDPVTRVGVGAYATRVGPTAAYGRRVELGYPGGAGRGRQATRPFPYLRPAYEQVYPLLTALAAEKWRAAL